MTELDRYRLTIDPGEPTEVVYENIAKSEVKIRGRADYADVSYGGSFGGDADLVNRTMPLPMEYTIEIRGDVYRTYRWSLEATPQLPGQLTLDPIMPKSGTVKAAVLRLLMYHPDGLCRRDFANEDIYELSNRIGELEKDGWTIWKGKCERHNHRHPFTLYSM